MIRIARWCCIIAVCVAIVSACDGGGSDDSSTHWLEGCTATAECGSGLECLCGVCTKSCAAAADCAGLGAGAACLSMAGSSCRQELVCGLSCTSGADCRGGLVCVSGACERPPGGDASVASGDASASGGRADSGAAGSAAGGDGGGRGANAGGAQSTGGIDGSVSADSGGSSDGGVRFDAGTGGAATSDADVGRGGAREAGVSDGGSVLAAACADVRPSGDVLIDLGHVSEIRDVQATDLRVASRDVDGNWILWNRATHRLLQRGVGTGIRLAGDTLAVLTSTGVDLREATDGHLTGSLSGVPSAVGIAPNGTYVWTTTSSSLSLFSPSGAPLASRPGNYSTANVFCTPTEIRVASGAAGKNVIETVSVPGGVSTTSPAFSGTFTSWFLTGDRFFTNVGNVYRIYSLAGDQLEVLSLTAAGTLVGKGDYFYDVRLDSTTDQGIDAYQVGGAATPIASVGPPTDGFVPLSVAGPELVGDVEVCQNEGYGRVAVRKLDGSQFPTQYYDTTAFYPSALTSDGISNVIVGTRYGALFDYRDGVMAPLGCGAAFSIAGNADGVAAIATPAHQILVVDVATRRLVRVVDFMTDHVGLGDNGILVGSGVRRAYQYSPDRTLVAYDVTAGSEVLRVPGHTLLDTTYRADAWTSSDGTLIGQGFCSPAVGNWPCTYSTLDLSGTETPIGSAAIPYDYVAMALSPNGHLVALPQGPLGAGTTTNLYENGAVVGAANGVAVGWIDDSRLLVNEYTYSPKFDLTSFANAHLVDKTGASIGSTPLPELAALQSLAGGTKMYAPGVNKVYSTSTWAALWTGSTTASTTSWGIVAGAVAGNSVVYAHDFEVHLETFTP